MTRSARKPMCKGSWYSPNEKVWRLSSQPASVLPRSRAGRIVIIRSSRGARRRGRHLLDGLDLDLDVDLLAHHHAACLEDLVPGEAEILPVERSLRGEAGALISPRVLRAPRVLDVEDDRKPGAADRQVAGQPEAVVTQRLDLRAFEGELRVPRRVEEVRRLQVRVAVGDARVDAGRVDRHLHLRALRIA